MTEKQCTKLALYSFLLNHSSPHLKFVANISLFFFKFWKTNSSWYYVCDRNSYFIIYEKMHMYLQFLWSFLKKKLCRIIFHLFLMKGDKFETPGSLRGEVMQREKNWRESTISWGKNSWDYIIAAATKHTSWILFMGSTLNWQNGVKLFLKENWLFVTKQ